MDVHSLKMAKVFSSGGDIHYVLPLFQREYTWERANWETLLNDLYAIYAEYVDDKVPEHFMGSLVVVEDGHRNGVVSAFRLVDGQQRLTTISLLLCALGQVVRESNPSLSNKIKKLLLNQDETGDARYKLFPTTKYGDRAFYTALLDEKPWPSVQSRIREAYLYLLRELERKVTTGEIDAERLFVLITTSLQVVLINLNAKESPYQIFESLNAKGKPLSQADLVRNYIAMKVTALDQEALYADHWAEIEVLLQEQRMVGRSGLGELTAFLRHYLAMHTGVLANQSHVYARFRDRMEAQFKEGTQITDELAALHRFASYYSRFLRPEYEPVDEIRLVLQRLNTMDAATAYPFLLALFSAADSGLLTPEEHLEALITLENYLVRRYLAGEGINYLTKMFPTLWKSLNTADFIPSLKANLASRNYPFDGRVRQAVLTRAFYENKSGSRDKLVLVLDSVNRHLSRFEDVETSLKGEATVEHILPQTPPDDWKEKWKVELGPDWQQFYDDYLEWKADLGDDWEQTYRDYLHTMGNLTLVTQKWQMKLSNKPFAIKKTLLVGQGLHLNRYFEREISRWDEDAIQQRAHALTDSILEIWPAFAVPAIPPNPGGGGGAGSTTKRNWDEASTFNHMETCCGPQATETARAILSWAKERSLSIWWSVNSTEGSFVPIFKHRGRSHQLFVVRAGGEVELYFYWYQYKPPFDAESKRLELLERLNAISGLEMPNAVITKRPTFPITRLADESAREQFLRTFEWFIDQVVTSDSVAEQTALEVSAANSGEGEDGEGETASGPGTPTEGQARAERTMLADSSQSTTSPQAKGSQFASGSLPLLQLDYWTTFSQHLIENNSFLKPRTPLPQKWMSFAIGRSRFDTAAEINAAEKSIQVSINIDGPDRFHFFDQLYEQRQEIEAEFEPFPEAEMVWGRLPDRKFCRIRLTRYGSDPANREQWAEQHRWLQERLETLHHAFADRVLALRNFRT